MPPCSALCKNGRACSFEARPGLIYCGRHAGHGRPVANARCSHVKGNGLRCSHPREEGHEVCAYHVRILQDREERFRMRELLLELVIALWDVNGTPDEARRILEDHQIFTRTLRPDSYERLSRAIEEEIEEWMELNMPGGVVPISDLHRLVLDGQNVHTQHVVKQTNDTAAFLLDTPPPRGQHTIQEIKEAWAEKNRNVRHTVLKDIRKSYNIERYGRCLDGLWVRIKLSPHRSALVERLWEECFESLHMCEEGHVSRLCNVLVGFDDTCKAPVSVGELLQQKMAAIAANDSQVEYKVGEAWAVFEELGIPMEQRADWIDAF